MKNVLVFLILLTVPFHFVFAEETTDDQDNIRLHALSSDRLREIMQNINLSVHNSNNPDQQTEKIIEEDLANMIEAIEELLFHAELMASAIPDDTISETDIVTFRAMAGQLYTEALNIQQLTRNYNLNNYDYSIIDSAYHRLNQTCAACHTLFRDKQ